MSECKDLKCLDDLQDLPVLKIIQGGGFRQIENAIGILKAIEEIYPVDPEKEFYWAASAGAPVAAMAASGYTAVQIEELVRNTKASDLKKFDLGHTIKKLLRIKQSYVFNNKGMYEFIKSHMTGRATKHVQVSLTRVKDFQSVMMPATPESVLASTSIPEVFPIVKIGDEYYYDGGIKNNCPTPDICSINCMCCTQYRYVFFILCPFTTPNDKTYTEYESLITRLYFLFNEVMDREIAQIRENGWDRLLNCTVIQPPVYPESSLLDWSPNYGLIDHAYNYARDLLHNTPSIMYNQKKKEI